MLLARAMAESTPPSLGRVALGAKPAAHVHLHPQRNPTIGVKQLGDLKDVLFCVIFVRDFYGFYLFQNGELRIADGLEYVI